MTLDDGSTISAASLPPRPGSYGSTVDPPGDAHPGEWLVVYSFETATDLDAWVTSAARRRLLDASDRMFQGDVREQRIADRPAGGDVTLVSSVRLRAGTEGDHRRLHDDGVRAASNVGGLVRAELLPAVDGVQPDTVALLTFASRGDLDRWLASPERAEIVTRMAPLLIRERTLNVVGGFAGWFAPGHNNPKRWKQALTVVAALIPVTLAVTATRTALLPDPPALVAVVIGSVANVAILTWVVMPALSRRLEFWLVR